MPRTSPSDGTPAGLAPARHRRTPEQVAPGGGLGALVAVAGVGAAVEVRVEDLLAPLVRTVAFGVLAAEGAPVALGLQMQEHRLTGLVAQEVAGRVQDVGEVRVLVGGAVVDRELQPLVALVDPDPDVEGPDTGAELGGQRLSAEPVVLLGLRDAGGDTAALPGLRVPLAAERETVVGAGHGEPGQAGAVRDTGHPVDVGRGGAGDAVVRVTRLRGCGRQGERREGERQGEQGPEEGSPAPCSASRRSVVGSFPWGERRHLHLVGA